MTAPVEEGPPTGGGGSVFTRKLGPFPTWVWMGLGLAAMLAYASISKNKKAAAAAAQQNTGTLPTNPTASGSTPASLIPQFVNQVYNQESPPTVNLTNNVTTPVTVKNTENEKTTVTPPATPPPPSATPPPPKPAPQPPQGQWVTVGVWTSTNAPWNSTLWGIAQHIYGNGALYPKIFAANKSGVMRPDGTAGFISDPNLIHPGDRIWVPA